MAVLIHHADTALIVADKPAGLLAVPGRGPDKQDCLSVRIQQRYPDALIVHRLDMDTSGLICFARGIEHQRALSRAFAERRVSKRYTACVVGRMEGVGEINLPLMVDWPHRPKSKVDHEAGKPSLTRWRVQDYDAAADITRVELEPVTGRSHQLRVHLAALGHPIVGDPLYGQPAARMLLHATVMALAHPEDGRFLEFASPALF